MLKQCLNSDLYEQPAKWFFRAIRHDKHNGGNLCLKKIKFLLLQPSCWPLLCRSEIVNYNYTLSQSGNFHGCGFEKLDRWENLLFLRFILFFPDFFPRSTRKSFFYCQVYSQYSEVTLSVSFYVLRWNIQMDLNRCSDLKGFLYDRLLTRWWPRRKNKRWRNNCFISFLFDKNLDRKGVKIYFLIYKRLFCCKRAIFENNC